MARALSEVSGVNRRVFHMSSISMRRLVYTQEIRATATVLTLEVFIAGWTWRPSFRTPNIWWTNQIPLQQHVPSGTLTITHSAHLSMFCGLGGYTSQTILIMPVPVVSNSLRSFQVVA